MDLEPPPAILNAVERGRGQRGKRHPERWSGDRARLVTWIAMGLGPRQIAGQLGVTRRNVDLLLGEACDAVLRGGLPSAEADCACALRWQRWCGVGDVAACERVRRMIECD